MNENDIVLFAELLEKSGYKGALSLIREDLITLAKRRHISLFQAASEYANQDEEQDTSWYQLFQALQRVSHKKLEALKGIHQML
ncbi:MAG TPA: hypothetical protein VMR73_01790 [Candidatus Paceibacterota bacterium]|nr:hypothetical protein [Candidatus Paceibacterota bacterium]